MRKSRNFKELRFYVDMWEFIEDWVASLRLRPRIGQDSWSCAGIGSLRSSYGRELVRIPEVVRGLGRFAPVTAANWSGFLKLCGDWVASLRLRPRIGQDSWSCAGIGSLRSSYGRELVRIPGGMIQAYINCELFLETESLPKWRYIFIKYPISYWSKSLVPISYRSSNQPGICEKYQAN